ncbi:MAG TPA: flagellar biosynthesis protein FliQ [Acidobacteriota bacterium]|nr:flagellar biosynthesis protein FliQ [Acidobacteriota bacterium]
MSQQALVDLVTNTVEVTLIMAGPLLAVALVVGLMISIFQVVTSIQDLTLSFVPRIIAVFLIALILFPWMMDQAMTFTIQLFSEFRMYAQ